MLRLMTAMAASSVGEAPAPPPVSGTGTSATPGPFLFVAGDRLHQRRPGSVYANISRRATYELSLSPGCPQIDRAPDIAVRARGTQRICSGYDVALIVLQAIGSGTQRCLIRTIRRLSDAERDAGRAADAR